MQIQPSFKLNPGMCVFKILSLFHERLEQTITTYELLNSSFQAFTLQKMAACDSSNIS